MPFFLAELLPCQLLLLAKLYTPYLLGTRQKHICKKHISGRAVVVEW